jgi:hypothetical protein
VNKENIKEKKKGGLTWASVADFGPTLDYSRAAHQPNGSADCVTPRVRRHHRSLPQLLAGMWAQWVGHTSVLCSCYADVWVRLPRCVTYLQICARSGRAARTPRSQMTKPPRRDFRVARRPPLPYYIARWSPYSLLPFFQ